MRILVCGGNGYIGSALCSYLNDKGYHGTSVDVEWFGTAIPLSRWNTIRRMDYGALKADSISKYDVVIVTAAHSSVSMCQKDPYGAFQNNVVNFVNLLQKMGPHQKLIYMSSSCVYTGHQEVCYETALLLPPVDHLTLTKQTIDHYALKSGIQFYGLRPGSVNGWSPNLRSDLMINAMTMSGLTKGVVQVSNVDQYRPILAMDDLCRAVEAITNCGEDRRGIYNLANFNVRIGVVGEAVAEITGVPLENMGGPRGYDFRMDCSHFCRTFDFEFKSKLTDIVHGLVVGLQNKTGLVGGRDVNMEYKGV